MNTLVFLFSKLFKFTTKFALFCTYIHILNVINDQVYSKRSVIMKNRLKLELINNYVDIFKIIYNCKYIASNGSDINENENALKHLKESLKLKEAYEKTFQTLKIADVSFLLLKQQLENALNVTPQDNYTPTAISIVAESKTKISKTLNSVLLKYGLI